MTLFRILFVFVVLASPAHAVDTSGSASLGLAMQMYCGAYNVLSGNLGLLIGLVFAAYGLWVLIVHGSFGKGISIVTAGALLTALPGLTSSFFQGVGDYLYSIGISTTSGGPLRIATDIAERSGCSGINIDWNNFDMDAPNYWQKGGGASQGLPDYKGSAEGKYRPTLNMSGPTSCQADPPSGSCLSSCQECSWQGVTTPSTARPYQNIIPNQGGITSCFGHRTVPPGYQGNPAHGGMDLKCGGNVPIYAGISGEVVSIGIGGNSGYSINIAAGNGAYHYAHLMGPSPLRPGTSVAPSDVIGTCGGTGSAAGRIHLHLEFHPTDGKPCGRIDPFGRLPSGGPPPSGS